MLPSKIELEAERARRSLPHFVQSAWASLQPATPFVDGFHVDAICAYLEAVARGELRRLLINIPPRHGKSLITSVAFPAWAWISWPELCWLFSSYGIELAVRDSGRMRRLIESPWYRAHYGDRIQLTRDQNEKHRFENTAGGVRLATSVGGAATGEGGDVVIIDDPHKIEQAASAAQRESVLEWFDGTISTRLNDPRTGRIVIIGQRLHEADLFGHLLADGDWEHLCLPAEYEPAHPFLWPDDPRTTPGELLWPERFGAEQNGELKRRLGSYGAAAQLQQLPSPAGGGIFQRHWWRYHDPTTPWPTFEEILQAWDLTFSGGPNADYVVGQLWGLRGSDCYLIRQTRAQLGFAQTLQAIREMTAWAEQQFPDHPGHAVLIEEAANASAVVEVLRREIPGIIPIRPMGDKISRAHAVSPSIESGNIHVPGAPNADHTGYDRGRTPSWVQTFIEETATFPNGANDDQVDALTLALSRAYRPQPRVRVLSAPPTARPLLGRR